MSGGVLAVVYGTRPEAVKLASVVDAARAMGGLDVRVIATGQHRELLRNADAALAHAPDIELDLMQSGQTPAEFGARAAQALDGVFASLSPAMVVAQGDTTTAFAATLAAFHRRIPSGHVEAGLRTYDLSAPFPEEGYRQMIDRVATRLYAPTTLAADHLRREGRSDADILVTGNTGIDAVLKVAASGSGQNHGTPPFVLATLHRREAHGEPLRRMCRALRRLALEGGLSVVIPVHPNPSVEATVHELLGGLPSVKLLAPMPYPDLVRTMLSAVCVITDSGGIQEEAPTLGVPVLVTRETTERPEAVDAGSALLVGSDEERIVQEALRLHQDAAARSRMAVPRPVYGDGRAGERIAADVKTTIGLATGRKHGC
jgi:UDP-N-acetylglucosamine 2-epimerase (non-hydrolysing)